MKLNNFDIHTNDVQDSNDKTMRPVDDGTLLPGMLDDSGDNDGTMISHSAHGTLVRDMDIDNTLGSNLGTMVINSDGEDDEDSTMKRKDFNRQFIWLFFFQTDYCV